MGCGQVAMGVRPKPWGTENATVGLRTKPWGMAKAAVGAHAMAWRRGQWLGGAAKTLGVQPRLPWGHSQGPVGAAKAAVW